MTRKVTTIARADDLLGSSQVEIERREIPRVHAQDAGARCQGGVELSFSMDLDERRQSPGAGCLAQHAQLFGRDGTRDQQHSARAGSSRFHYLQLVEDEVLAEHGYGNRGSHARQVLERSSKVRPFGEHRNGHGAAAQVRPRVDHRIEVGADRALRR